MMHLTPLKRFSFICILCLSIFGLIFGWLVTRSIEANMLARSRQLTAEFILQVVTREFLPEDLSTPRNGNDYELFSRKVSQRVLGSGIIRAKVWNMDRQIVWSDDRRLVGQRFTDNDELGEALKGEISSEISNLAKAENNLEHQYSTLMELYVPVRFSGTPEVVAVFEVYQKLDKLYADVLKQKQLVWGAILIGFSILYALLYNAFLGATRRIEQQNEERKIIERHLVNAERQQMVSTIAASMGHELNNALSGMVGYVELLKRSPQNTELYARFLTILPVQLSRLEMFGRELLTIGTPQKPSFGPIVLNDIFNEVITTLSGSGLLKNHRINKDFSSTLPHIIGDKGLLEQVFTNLVINAIHAMEKGGDLTCITNLSKRQGYVEIVVKDSGHGIPDGIKDKIFEAFFTTKEPGKGTGLGMYIVKQLIEQHGGVIRVLSEVDKGTSMVVELPVIVE